MPDNIRRIHINELKAGDIIYYNDRSQRVIQYGSPKINDDDGIKLFLSISGVVALRNSFVNLVKSAFDGFEIGDLVCIDQIPNCEKQIYFKSWSSELESIADGKVIFEVENIAHTPYRGTAIRVNGHWLMSYHAKKIKSYDII